MVPQSHKIGKAISPFLSDRVTIMIYVLVAESIVSIIVIL